MAQEDYISVRKAKRYWQHIKLFIYNNAVSKFRETFKTNETVGALDSGTTIQAGTDVVSVLKSILVKLKEAVIKSYPSVSISNSGTAFGDYEVGTEVTPVLSSTYTDGVFTSYEDVSTTQNLAAGCSKGATTYLRGMSALAGNTESYVLPLGTTTYRVEQAFGASTNVPKNSDGSNSSIFIAAGVCDKGGNYNAYLRLFTGVFASQAGVPSSNLRAGLTAGSLVKSAPSFAMNFSNKVIAIAVPSQYTLRSAIEPLTGEDERPYLAQNGTNVQIADVNGGMQNYKLYVFAYDGVLGKSVNLVFS